MTSAQAANVAEVVSLHPSIHEGPVFGEQTFERIALDSIVVLSQMRIKHHVRFQALKESIRAHGLVNRPNVAAPEENQLAEYIDFTNKTWGDSVSLKDFKAQRYDDGSYRLAVAGHNRIQAMVELTEEQAEASGHPLRGYTWCQIEPDASVGSIVGIQAAENVHVGVPQEREAMAVVEWYMHGLGKDWKNQAEFIKQNDGRVSLGMLRDALSIATLSPEIRNLVFEGHISYVAGIGLGRLAPVVQEWVKHRAGAGATAARSLRLQAAAQTRLFATAIYIHNHGLNSTASKAYIKGVKDKMLSEIAILKGDDNDLALEFNSPVYGMASAEEQARKIEEQEARYLASLILEANKLPHEKTVDLSTKVTKHDRTGILSAALADVVKSKDRLITHLSRAATTG